MLDALPDLYEEVYESRVLMATEGQEIDDLTTNIADTLEQSNVNKATWGLARWEAVLGIQTDAAKPYDQRRSVIKSKLRGTGTVTASLIKRVAEAYNNGTVDVTEINSLYKIHITFVSNHGVPENLTDIEEAIKDILPAHLAIDFVFTYMNWSAFDAKGFTWGSLTANNYTWDQLERLT